MKKCPKCGKTYDDTWKACLHCSVALSDNLSIKETNPEIRERQEKKSLPLFAIISIVLICLAVIIGPIMYVRNNVMQAFKIPSGAMEPTLLQGDRIFADKAIYKKSDPKRGDIIVFISPDGTKKVFVKRLVGLSGETIEIKSGSILINGTIASEPSLTNRYYHNRGEYAKEGQPVKIPSDNYFVLGDNSASSRDSRYFGFVPKKNLLGKAVRIYYPSSRSGIIK